MQWYSQAVVLLALFGAALYFLHPFITEQRFRYNKFNVSRDFLRYSCEDKRRIGGHPSFLPYAQHSLDRVEGAWFICFDKGISVIENACTILSFGVNDDESFDRAMNNDYGCRVESFDPFVENGFFQVIRNKDPQLAQAVTLTVNPKWHFHRIGIVDENSKANEKQIGWMTSFNRILDYVKLKNKVIDIFKMDIEMGEWIVLDDLNVNYMCKYVKQFVLETHAAFIFPDVKTDPARHIHLLRKFEKCFNLFHRDTRFFKVYDHTAHSEFQEPISYSVPLKEFKTEIKLIDYMVTYGELYFVNTNFLPHNYLQRTLANFDNK